MPFRYIISSFFVVFLTPSVQAQPLQSLASIEQAAYVHALHDAQASYSQPQVLVDSLDKRLRLQQCDEILHSFSNSVSNTVGSRTIGVKCQGSVEWTVYVPVKVKVVKPVVVSSRPLPANQTLTERDVRLEPMDIAELRHGYQESLQQVIGQQLKYPLSVGMVIPTRSLKQERVIRRGEQIVLLATAGTMEVRMNGTALDDASVGERVKVKNSSSQRVVEGIVQAPGIVKVTM
jgi:flagella basal body P-ring formation protein FlgA